MRAPARVAALALALTAASAAWGVAPARAAEEPTLTVRGEGTGRATPDSATIVASVRRRARSAAAARAQANARTRAVISALLATGLDRAELQTSSIGLTREPPRPGARTPFVASTSITVDTRRVDRVAALVAAATRAGADGVDGPRFRLADSSWASIAATEAALADARRRADAAANALGMRVSGVRSVTLDPVSVDTPSARDGAPAGSTAPPVEPGQAEVRVTAVVVYELDG